MNPPTHLRFVPHHNASALIQNDRMALAHQLQLCRTEHSGWQSMSASTEGAQAFASRHLVSVVMLVLVAVSAIDWLIG
jgi:hypothetical protein